MICLLVLLSGTSAIAAASQAVSPSGGADRQAIASNDLDTHFKNAQKDFLENHLTQAGAEIRKGAGIIKQEAATATGEAKGNLLDSADNLDQLAKRVELGHVSSEADLRAAFTQAHTVLAENYHAKAVSSRNRKNATDVGKELSAAAGHIKQAWFWAGHRISEGARQAIASVEQLGNKIGKGMSWVDAEVDKAIDDIGKETGLLSATKGSSISVAPAADSKQADFDLSTAIIKVAKETIPAVAHIQVIEREEVANPLLPYENDPYFRRFFNLPKHMPKKLKRELMALGSGMIIDPQGHILTNNHVVSGATKIQVLLNDGTQYTAKVVGTDPKTDLGVIQISADKPLPFVTFGDSDAMDVGQWVVAIGQPRGLDQSVTQGIISAKHRTQVTNPSGYEDFLQTDAPINPGNSGGPLLNLRSEVIGVNSAILSQSGGFEGIGFAIPSNMAVHIARQLIAHGKVIRGWLGVDVQNLTPDLAKSFGLTSTDGALISDVNKQGPAARAGLKPGDIILDFGQKRIQSASELRDTVADAKPGAVVDTTIWQNGKRMTVKVTVENQEELVKQLASSIKERLGASVEPVTDQDALRYGLRSPEGVKISWVDPKGPMGKVGFEKGDLVLAVNGHPAEDVQSFAEAVMAVPHHKTVKLMALEHATGRVGSVEVTVE